jgi:putative ABC transport system permease protein
VRVWDSSPQRGEPIEPIAPATFAAYRDETGVFAEIGAATDLLVNITGGGEPEAVIGYRFSDEVFKALAVPPALGRTFLPEEDRPGHDRVAVISHKLWQRRYAGDPGLVGRSVTLNGRDHVVVGVMPADFPSGPVEVWTPLALDPAQAADHERRFLRVFARLKPGVTLGDATAALARVARRLEQERPQDHAGWTALAEPITERMVRDIRPALLVLMAAVGLVLLIACANVANLLLVRAAARERETAVRVALGAGRGRIVRQWLAESLLICAVGGAAGILLAYWGVDLLLALFPRHLGNVAIPRLEAIHIDARVLGFGLLLTLGTALVFGLVPALRSAGADPVDHLREGGRGGEGPRRGRVRRALVVTEVALALVLASGAALMVRSFARLQEGRLGFDPENVLTFRVMLPEERYDEARQRAFVDDVVARITRLPGVQTAGAATFLPLSGWGGQRAFAVDGAPAPAPGQEPSADFRTVAGDFLGALRTPLIQGRGFTARDREDAPLVAIVNQAFARRFLPGGALGRRIDMRIVTSDVPRWREVVGVAADLRHRGLAEEVRPEVFVPFRQEPLPLIGFAVRTAGDPLALAGAARREVWAVDPDQPVSYVLALETMAAESLTLRRASMLVLVFFAATALALAALGLYGVMAHVVAQRTHEIGVRMALGAERARVMRMVVGQGLRLAGAGLALGLVGSLALTRVLSSMLFGVSPTDPATLATAALLLAATALVASAIPARRATRVDPMVALRYE